MRYSSCFDTLINTQDTVRCPRPDQRRPFAIVSEARLMSTVTCAMVVVICYTQVFSNSFPHHVRLQAPGSRTTHLRGRVIDAMTGHAIAGATVTVSTPWRGTTTLSSDLSGAFVLLDAQDGSYRIAITARGYLAAQYGQGWPGGPSRSLVFTSAALSDDIEVFMWQPALLTGTVRDELGQPVMNGTVHLISRPAAGTGLRPTASTVVTNAQGAYRFSDLLPGKYVVGVIQSYRMVREGGVQGGNDVHDARWRLRLGHMSVLPTISRDEAATVYCTTFYPAAPDLATAELIKLQAGEERSGTDITIARVAAERLSGIVSGPRGPPAGAIVRVTRTGNVDENAPFGLAHNAATTDTDGRFVILGVPAGHYQLQAEFRFADVN